MKRREIWQAKNHSHSSWLALFSAGIEKVLLNGCFGKTMIVPYAEMCCFNVEAFASLAWCGKGLEFHPGPHPPASQTKDVHVTAFVLKAFYPPGYIYIYMPYLCIHLFIHLFFFIIMCNTYMDRLVAKTAPCSPRHLAVATSRRAAGIGSCNASGPLARVLRWPGEVPPTPITNVFFC